MIQISYSPNGVYISGHANYAETGKDIVCAAISALVQVVAAAMDKYTNDDFIAVLTPGHGVIRHSELSTEGQILRKALILGLEMIADEYPQNVRIERTDKALT